MHLSFFSGTGHNRAVNWGVEEGSVGPTAFSNLSGLTCVADTKPISGSESEESTSTNLRRFSL